MFSGQVFGVKMSNIVSIYILFFLNPLLLISIVLTDHLRSKQVYFRQFGENLTIGGRYSLVY